MSTNEIAALPSVQQRAIFEGLFFQRSAYPFIGIEPPVFLSETAAALAKWIVTDTRDLTALYREPLAIVAENVCRRLANLELYALTIRHEIENASPWRASTIVGSLLVGLFGSAKSLLDAGSVALTVAFSLPLANKEQDFAKAKFWTILRSNYPTVAECYESFRPLMHEIAEWRDSAVHRATPLVFVDANPAEFGDRAPEEVGPGTLPLRMPALPGIDFGTLPPGSPRFIEPLQKWTDWRPNLLVFAQCVCNNIISRLP